MTGELPRRLLAELIGTAILVFFGAGSVVAALTLGEGALDYPGLGMIAITFGLAIAIAVYAFGTTSGAHINPAVTVALASVGRFPWGEVPAYVGAQLVGGTVGAALIAAAFGGDAVDLGTGQTTIADGVSYGQAIVAEAIGTYLLRDRDHGPGRRPARARRLGRADDRPRGDRGDPGDRPVHRWLAEPGANLRPSARHRDRRRRRGLGRPPGLRYRAPDRCRARHLQLRRGRTSADV